MNIFIKSSLEIAEFKTVPVSTTSPRPVLLSKIINAPILCLESENTACTISSTHLSTFSPLISANDLVKILLLPIVSKIFLSSGWNTTIIMMAKAVIMFSKTQFTVYNFNESLIFTKINMITSPFTSCSALVSFIIIYSL